MFRFRFVPIAGLFLIFAVGLGCSAARKLPGVGDDRNASTGKTPEAHASERAGADGMVWRARAYPTGDKRTSAIMVERGTPAVVHANKPYEYMIRVTNLTDHKLEEVVVTDASEGNFKLVSTSPKASSSGKNLRWTFDAIPAGATQTIKVAGTASSTGTVKHCCDVEWASLLCGTIKVVQPELELSKTGTAEALVCDPIEYKVTVRNGGTGAARDVVIEDRLPDGVVTASGDKVARIKVGTLQSGESKSFTLTCKATKTGTFRNVSTASSGGGLEAKSGTVTTKVTQPVLTLEKKGPDKAFAGRTVTYSMTVKNTGDGEARNTIVEDTLPTGTRFVRASDGGRTAGGKVAWNLGTLKPGASRTVEVVLRAEQAATIRNTAMARAYCAKAVSATATTEMTGIPAILLEVVDLEDPIEVGGNETYVITVTNQGTAPGTNIRVVCEMEDAFEFVSASGATAGTHSGRTITLAPVRSLDPQDKASWRVVLKAKKEGDIRFKVKMQSDQLKRPVEETEATNLYR